MVQNFRMLFIWFLLLWYLRNSTSLDSLAVSQSIHDGETLISEEGTFEVGFFSPGTSTRRYVGIWYRNLSPLTVVWVANRENALQNNAGVLKLDERGLLVILNGTNSTIWWSNNTSSKVVKNPIAQLLDSGNLVVRNERDINEDNFLWQSFDYPCDKFLPGMKLGWNLVTGLDRTITSWKNEDDPSKGEYSMKLDLRGYPQVIGYKGDVVRFRSGSWNGQALVGYPIRPFTQYVHELVFNEKEVYYEYKTLDRSTFFIVALTPSGIGNYLLWTNQTRRIKVLLFGESEPCEKYAMCGANSICNMDNSSRTCDCIKGHVPKFPEQWNVSHWYNGCVPRNKSDCKTNNTDGFLRYTDMKIPDTSSSWFDKTMNLDECQKYCLKNCSCKAYANLDIRDGGSGCLLWFDDLIDMRHFSNGGQDLYLRVVSLEIGTQFFWLLHFPFLFIVWLIIYSFFLYTSSKLGTQCFWLLHFTSLSPLLIVDYIMLFTKGSRESGVRKKHEKDVRNHNWYNYSWIDCKCLHNNDTQKASASLLLSSNLSGVARIIYRNHFKRKLRKEGIDLSTFDFPIIERATENFTESNKLGEGGFGPVYKGRLKDGQEFAVKRLSKKSGQGLEEFKNEVVLIAKLQHRNLVKLIGCCTEGKERMLIYEYMQNKSLDYFIFGVLYLHQDSRLRIIHRDLKTSNILLDANLDPKISDFGLARTFCGDQVGANTNKVAGTYGYMPPEYATRGHFSMKSDVFSYGVIVLEIVSGKRNREFSDPKHSLNLLGHAWRLWTEERALELLDGVLRERFIASEVIRCIQVGLLCVQQTPEDRPDMSPVVLMLNGEKLLPNPKVPGFYTEGDVHLNQSKLKNPFSSNQISITISCFHLCFIYPDTYKFKYFHANKKFKRNFEDYDSENFFITRMMTLNNLEEYDINYHYKKILFIDKFKYVNNLLTNLNLLANFGSYMEVTKLPSTVGSYMEVTKISINDYLHVFIMNRKGSILSDTLIFEYLKRSFNNNNNSFSFDINAYFFVANGDFGEGRNFFKPPPFLLPFSSSKNGFFPKLLQAIHVKLKLAPYVNKLIFAQENLKKKHGYYSSSDKLDEVLLRLSNHQLSLGESMKTLTQKIDELLNKGMGRIKRILSLCRFEFFDNGDGIHKRIQAVSPLFFWKKEKRDTKRIQAKTRKLHKAFGTKKKKKFKEIQGLKISTPNSFTCLNTTKKTVFYIDDSTSGLKERLCKLGGGMIVIKIKTMTRFDEKPIVILQQMRSDVALLTLENGDLSRLSTMNTIEKSKKRIVFGYLDKLTEQMSSLLEIDHHIIFITHVFIVRLNISGDVGPIVESAPYYISVNNKIWFITINLYTLKYVFASFDKLRISLGEKKNQDFSILGNSVIVIVIPTELSFSGVTFEKSLLYKQDGGQLQNVTYLVLTVIILLEKLTFIGQFISQSHWYHNFTMLFIWFFLFSFMTRTSTSLDRLEVNQSIRDGETLVSAGGIIEVGFFSPGNSTRRYFGVWYKNVSPLTVVWVANRNTPLENKSGVLKLNEKGIIVLLNATNSTLWSSSNISSKARNNATAHLLDSGNFVVKHGHKTNSVLWQSFDYPGNTLMQGMKLGWDLETGLERSISSWKSVEDPAEGEYVIRIDLRGYPQMIEFKGFDIIFRSRSWNGLSTVGYPAPVNLSLPKFVFNEKEVYYEFEILDSSVFAIFTLAPSGAGQRIFWTTQTTTRQVISTQAQDQCEIYAFCGANSICSYVDNQATCECLRGYVPKSPDQWNIAIWLGGCVQKNISNCEIRYTDGFLKYRHMKLPDTSSSWFNKTMNLGECQKSCLKNCSCTAYANLDIRNGGSGCLLWFNILVDMRNFSLWGQDFYIRVPASELDDTGNRKIKKKIVGITVGVTTFGLIITCLCIFMVKNPGAVRKFYNKHYNNIKRMQDLDLPTFNLSVLTKATRNFSSENKLGEGGFGPVYKGTLIDGKEIAVKRLSKKSVQGLDEFKNEVALIAKLQHRNLVKLLGCCIEGEEKMLIYEYMPNQSLDYFVFDETKRKFLDRGKRFNIIIGIARGLLYLHQDSRLRIIHRDLKTSNILLDENLDPKISDFGLARSFLGDQVEANTNRVAGTYGYMPPEYAARGHFSVKSDVFSYGVIVLEIVSGKKNREFSDPEHYNNLLGHAWRLWTEQRSLDLLDEVLGEPCTPFEVIRCIQVGLLCVQQRPEDRPDMSSVVLMLNCDKELPKPKVPGFYTETDAKPDANSSFANHKPYSVNELSITMLDAR
ncbi:G-type lectin S-receptor-like serine/threonine-protein kinase [Glycine soja]